jgi:glutamyl-tRNA synthetase
MEPHGRYAPSPTGPLHLGNLRTALLAWLFARSQGARFVLRVDDLDPGRSRERFAAEQIADLRALGLDWDAEAPRSSRRGDAYAGALAGLEARGLVYPCFCTRAEIREAARAPHGPLPEGAYPGTCRALTRAERAAREAAGRPPALRVRAGGAVVEVSDELAGPVRGVVDDVVVRRNDGSWAYNLAVVVDDHDQDVGQVVRGADLLDTTPRQAWLHGRLGFGPLPRYAHVPLVLGRTARGWPSATGPSPSPTAGAGPDAGAGPRRARGLRRAVRARRGAGARGARGPLRPGPGATHATVLGAGPDRPGGV